MTIPHNNYGAKYDAATGKTEPLEGERMSETLRYSSFTENGGSYMLTVQLSGGGASVGINRGDDAGRVIASIRYLADMLETGINERALTEIDSDGNFEPDYTDFPFGMMTTDEIAQLMIESEKIGDRPFVNACREVIKNRKGGALEP